MITSIVTPDATKTPQPARKRWEAPAIVLERALQVSAQDGPPTDPNLAGGFLGPLSTSAGAGGNICT